MWGILDASKTAVVKVIHRPQDVRTANGTLVPKQTLRAATTAQLATWGVVPIVDQVPTIDQSTHKYDADPILQNVGGTWTRTATSSPKPAADIANVLRQRVRGLFQSKVTEGFQYAGKVFEIDPDSQRKIDSEIKTAETWDAVYTSAGVTPVPTWSIGPGWRAVDDTFMPVTKQEFLLFGIAVRDHVRALHGAKWTHWAAIDALVAADDAASLLAYDVTTDWPQTGLEWEQAQVAPTPPV